MSSQEEKTDQIAELAMRVSEGLRRVSAYSVLFNQAVADQVGLNATDLRCLDLIGRMGPVTPGQLAKLTSLTSGAITGILDRLERRGFVARQPDPSDRRRVIVSTTPVAFQTVGPLFMSLAAAMDELCRNYSPEELAIIVDFVERLEPVMQAETAKVRERERGAAT